MQTQQNFIEIQNFNDRKRLLLSKLYLSKFNLLNIELLKNSIKDINVSRKLFDTFIELEKNIIEHNERIEHRLKIVKSIQFKEKQ